MKTMGELEKMEIEDILEISKTAKNSNEVATYSATFINKINNLFSDGNVAKVRHLIYEHDREALLLLILSLVTVNAQTTARFYELGGFVDKPPKKGFWERLFGER